LCFEVDDLTWQPIASMMWGLKKNKNKEKKKKNVFITSAIFQAMVMSLPTSSFLQEFGKSIIRHGRPHVI